MMDILFRPKLRVHRLAQASESRAALKGAARRFVVCIVLSALLFAPVRLGLSAIPGEMSGSYGPLPDVGPWLNSTHVPYDDPPTVGRYEILELAFDVVEQVDNPYDTYLLKLAVRDPSGVVTYVDGFYDGDGLGGQSGTVWKARLSPYELGTWDWWTVTADAPAASIASLSGTFDVVESPNLGGVVVNGQHFEFQSGDPIYLVGNFLDLRDDLESTHVYMSERLTDTDRAAILNEQVVFHRANKVNIYLANKGDYSSRSVTPWLGDASSNDKTQMELARWLRYDAYLEHWRQSGLLTSLWFFADDSGFGTLSQADQERLIRYGMARTSASSATLYVLALEWGEGFTRERISALGEYAQEHNPWGRAVSVHNHTDWAFSGESWATFVATQAGNAATPSKVNIVAREMRENEAIPHIDEEYGILNDDIDVRLRSNMWANFCGGAAGGGTGSNLAPLVEFLATSRIPFQRMAPRTDLFDDETSTQFCLAEVGHHYLVYSRWNDITINLEGDSLDARWFNPREGTWVGDTIAVSSGETTLVPPTDEDSDWVLWITDGTNLTAGVTHTIYSADLAISQQASTGNGFLVIDLALQNQGPAMAVSVCLTDTLPSCMTRPYVSASGMEIVARDGHDNAWCLTDPMPAGSQVTVTLQGWCCATEQIVNRAEVWWPGNDPVSSNNSSHALVYPTPCKNQLFMPFAVRR